MIVSLGAPAGICELDALIEKAARRGFMWHQFRIDRHGPEVLAGVFQWRACADVLVLVDNDRSHAYRTPTNPTTDVFAPMHVYWWYGGTTAEPGKTLPGVGMVWVLRALLTLPGPDEHGAQFSLIPAPKGTGVHGSRVPVRICRRNIYSTKQ
ncbi:hypothetical protein GCM10027436_52320 [Actinophytocola sediminis]